MERRKWRTRVTGTVKKVVSERGFGFITGEDGQEYFFHRSGLNSALSFESLAANQRVSFEVQSSDKGPRAIEVRAA
jgi:cold shock protein